ncbi:MAG TPA: carbon starvation CstA family protein [Candidatus Aminicenantes bacterium]|nr:carbon starvation CstA family protein [Candidatus Aminicenantes bacterium]
MNVLVPLLLAAAVFLLAGRFYARFIARSVGEKADRPTPAVTLNDGRDYVPTERFVVFAHHFSAIAGAGPILGPTMAILYGFVPAWLWVVLGGVFIGAVHDYATLFISMREGGKSMAEVARKTLGGAGFNLFISFTIVMIVLVTSSFLSATAISLTSLWPLAKIGVREGETFLKTVVRDGVVMGRIGGIASMSVVVITLCSPLLGVLLHKKGLKTAHAYVLAAAVCAGSIVLGIIFPVTLASTTWMVLISVYVLVAAGVPVWLILQPRDFINVQILYGGIGLMIVSLLSCGVQGLRVTAPRFNLAEGTLNLGFVWPMMFITIACGAISGFHCLVGGGTTGKQLAREPHARHVGFNAMLLESFLAVCVLLALGGAMAFTDYKAVVWPADPAVKSNPILGFSLAAGRLFHQGLGIPVALGTVFGILLVEGFVVTTLDAAVRLNRYLFEELWTIVFKRVPSLFRHYWVNSGLAVLLMWVLAYSNAFNALWPIFGAANQLLAAMALLTASAWLLLRRRRNWYTLVPAVFMVVTTLVALGILLVNYIRDSRYLLIGADLLLLALAAGVVTLAVRTFLKRGRLSAPVENVEARAGLGPE